MKAFSITQGKGFGITFPNGYQISVQFGYGNYCDNYNAYREPGESTDAHHARLGVMGSDNAECAVFNEKGDMVTLPDVFGGQEVTNRSDSAQVLALMNWAASQFPEVQS